MALQRRNVVTRRDAQFVAVVALAAAVLAAFADAAPTGQTAVDALLVAGFAAGVTWLAATAPWWALAVGAGMTLTGSLPGPVFWTVVAVAAVGAAGWIGWTRANQPVLRAAIGAAVVQVALRLEWNPFFLSSALLAFVAIVLIAVTGLLRRKRYVRKRVYWTLAGTTAFAVLAIGGLGYSASQARTTARDGYTGMLDGLDQLQAGQTAEASETLRQVASDLDAASNDLSGPLAQPARLVPGVAQNRDSAAALIENAATTAGSAADALSVVDLDRLTVTGGKVDVEALVELQAPLADLSAAVDDLRTVLDDADSPWLAAPLQSRLATVSKRADQAAHQAAATAATARIAPAMLGADDPRSYLVAFVNSAEARGQGGVMGNWSVVTADNGKLTVTGNGRTADLQADSLRDFQLDVSPDYIARYGDYGASNAPDDGVLPKFWSNVTMSADMPDVGSPMAQMYEQATGQAVDGVFVVDPVGLGALVDVVGSIDVPSLDRSFTGDELRDFLLLGQYELEEAEREQVLEEITQVTIETLFSDSLPPPQQLAEQLSDAALNGHLTAWAERSEEQQLLELVGMDGSLPDATQPGTDALAVVSNASGNKIENFLERTIEYRAVADQRTGEVTARVIVTMTNTAPTRGYSEYVIGNIIDEPIGTNRMLLDVYSRLDVTAARIDGEDVEINITPEVGYAVFRNLLTIAPGKSVVVELDLEGNVGPGAYQLAYRPQPLPNPDQLVLAAETSGGGEIFSFEGELARRSVLSADGVSAWRPVRDR